MTRALSIVGLLVWLAVLIWSMISFHSGAPGMAVIGTSLSSFAPLVFVSGIRRWSLVSPSDPHPVMASVLTGFGVVLTMVAVNRFGEQFERHVVAAGLALVMWLIWVRWSWRRQIDEVST